MEKHETILNKYKEWHWFCTFNFCLTLLIKNNVVQLACFCVLLWYRNWYRELWIFTGIGTEYWNFGTVTTLMVTFQVKIMRELRCYLCQVRSKWLQWHTSVLLPPRCPLHGLCPSEWVGQWCPTLFLETYLPAKFSSNPDQTRLNQLIKIFRSTCWSRDGTELCR